LSGYNPVEFHLIASLIGSTTTNPGKADFENFDRAIAGRRYRAQNFRQVAQHESKQGFSFCIERLYRSERGSYLLIGEGHGLTAWRHNSISGYGVGHAYVALSDRQAADWLTLRGTQHAVADLDLYEDA